MSMVSGKHLKTKLLSTHLQTVRKLGSVPAMSQAEVDEVYAAAKAALPAWRALSYAERAAYLHKAADILERDAEKIRSSSF